jgi:uncharacterized membrane protein YsdA (DUF1294 family)
MSLQAPAALLARRELVVVAVTLVALAKLVDRADALVLAVLLPLAILVAGSAALRGGGRVPAESLLVPAVLTGGAGAAIQLVPAGLGIVPALALFAFGLDRILALEIRLLAQPTGTSDADRARILAAAVVTAFVAFTGVAAIVPGGLPEPGAAGGGTALAEGSLLVLALGDALAALALGYRVAAARYPSRRDAARSAVTYAIVIAVAAGALRAIEVPRLVGPAALTLVFYLWDALHATAPDRRREPRFLWETLLLGVLAVVVVAWNLRLRA